VLRVVLISRVVFRDTFQPRETRSETEFEPACNFNYQTHIEKKSHDRVIFSQFYSTHQLI